MEELKYCRPTHRGSSVSSVVIALRCLGLLLVSYQCAHMENSNLDRVRHVHPFTVSAADRFYLSIYLLVHLPRLLYFLLLARIALRLCRTLLHHSLPSLPHHLYAVYPPMRQIPNLSSQPQLLARVRFPISTGLRPQSPLSFVRGERE